VCISIVCYYLSTYPVTLLSAAHVHVLNTKCLAVGLLKPSYYLPQCDSVHACHSSTYINDSSVMLVVVLTAATAVAVL
jgi:hypothetical protein